MPERQSTDLVRLGLLFDAIREEVRLADANCADPTTTRYLLAIEALAEQGCSAAERLWTSRRR